MRRALMSFAVLASVFAVGQAKANFIGWGDGIDCLNNDGINVLGLDFGNCSLTWNCPDDGSQKNWNLTGDGKPDVDWKDLGSPDVDGDDDACHWHHHGDPSVDPSITPSVTPSGDPAAAVPLPAGAWAGLIGIGACGLVTVARRKVVAA
jgi:hypothetical protein